MYDSDLILVDAIETAETADGASEAKEVHLGQIVKFVIKVTAIDASCTAQFVPMEGADSAFSKIHEGLVVDAIGTYELYVKTDQDELRLDWALTGTTTSINFAAWLSV